MPLDELGIWQAYDLAELLPDRRNEVQLATIAHTLAVVNSKHPGAYRLEDFMPSQQSKQQTPLEFLEGLKNGN